MYKVEEQADWDNMVKLYKIIYPDGNGPSWGGPGCANPHAEPIEDYVNENGTRFREYDCGCWKCLLERLKLKVLEKNEKWVTS